MDLIEKRWRVFADRAEIELGDAVRAAKDRHVETGTLRSGPAIKAIYRTAAKLLDDRIELVVHPAISKAPDEVDAAKAALAQIAKVGEKHILAHAIWCKAYTGSTKAAVDDLCRMLRHRVELAFVANDRTTPVAVSEPKRKASKTPIPEARLRQWFENRKVEFTGKRPPRWQECWDSVRADYPQHQITKDRLQEMRREVIPEWRSGNR